MVQQICSIAATIRHGIYLAGDPGLAWVTAFLKTLRRPWPHAGLRKCPDRLRTAHTVPSPSFFVAFVCWCKNSPISVFFPAINSPTINHQPFPQKKPVKHILKIFCVARCVQIRAESCSSVCWRPPKIERVFSSKNRVYRVLDLINKKHVMPDQENLTRFIMLRSQGWSFNRLAVELGVSKPILIKWSRIILITGKNR